MKSLKKLSILLIILLLCVAAFFLIRLFSKDPEPIDAASLRLYPADTEDITELSWTRGGETTSLVKQDGSWRLKDAPLAPVDQSYPLFMLSAIDELVPIETLTKFESDPAVYGLDAPTCVISVIGSDSRTFRIGSPAEEGGYYLKSSAAEDRIYVITKSLLDDFSYGEADIIKLESLPVMSDVVGIEISDQDGDLAIRYFEDPEEAGGTGDSNWYVSEDEGPWQAADLAKISERASGIINLKWASCASYHAEDDELEAYGLGSSAVRAVIEYRSGVSDVASIALLIGNTEGSQRYVRLDGSRMVYLVDQSSVDTLLETGAVDLRMNN